MTLSSEQAIRIKAVANSWISENFPDERRYLGHTQPVAINGHWQVELLTWQNKNRILLGRLVIYDSNAVLVNDTKESISKKLNNHLERKKQQWNHKSSIRSDLYDFILGDGIIGSQKLDDLSVDLLLTDPPYGISNSYTCENQIPRRIRKNGKDFIMPKGSFGQWDYNFPPPMEWTKDVLPKVRGWAVIFCAQAQIGEYSMILKKHKFVAVGTLVWQKTNPVPFNHTHKPINAWEAAVIGKRPGTKFNGRLIHNVFVYKSPSPQQRIHPTQKPLSLIVKFVKMFSSKGGVVFDPFAGSGTTLVAATSLQRRVIAFEKDRDYYASACNRISTTVPMI